MSQTLLSDTLLIDAQYFPCLDYFALILQYEKLIVEKHENFQKQTARNRCYIRGANKIERLSVPVLRPSGQKILTSEIQISSTEKWKREHWRAIQTAYANAPFFEFYAPFIEAELFQPYENLFDLNIRLLKLLFKLLNISKPIHFSENYEITPAVNVVDFRNKVGFSKKIIQSYPSYIQVFGNKFTPNLSILDLLFCQGNQAKSYLLNLAIED